MLPTSDLLRLRSVTVSPVSVAALGQISAVRGLSLRFPRFIRVREDKKIDDVAISRVEQISPFPYDLVSKHYPGRIQIAHLSGS